MWEPVSEEASDVGLELWGGHSPEVGVEDAFHSSWSEDFGEGKKEEKDEGEEAAGGFFLEDVGAEEELGVPGDDGLVEVEKNVVLGSAHEWKIRTCLAKGNFNRGGFGVNYSSMKQMWLLFSVMGFALGQVPVVPVLNELLPDQEVSGGEAPLVLNLSDFFGVEEVRDEVVRFSAEWTLLDGSARSAEVDFLLFRDRTPITVENFRGYVNRGDYTDMVVHRLVPGFVIQGGGFTATGPAGMLPMVEEVPKLTPIMNEFGVSNTLGTISMAKLGGDPNSATSEWFISTGANSDNLDFQNGGFTVFGRVSQGTFANAQALDELEGFTLFNLGGALTNAPLVSGTTQASFEAGRFFRFRSVTEVPLPPGQAGLEPDLGYSAIRVSGASGPEMSVVGSNLELSVPAASIGGRSVVMVRGEDSVGNEVEDRFEVLMRADYESWRRAVFPAAEVGNDALSGPLADPNGDGVTNFMLFLQGLPLGEDVSEMVSLPRFNFFGNSLVAEMDTGFVAGVGFQLEGCDDLESWEVISATESLVNGATGMRVTLTSDLDFTTVPKRFFRIRYTLN